MRPELPIGLRLPDPREVPVFILAGGQGTRLRGVESRPKAIIPVAGLPFLSYTLRLLRLQGFERIVLLLGMGAEEVRAVFAAEGLIFREETEPRGTGGALGGVGDLAGPVSLVLNGDSYAEVFYPDLLAMHAGSAARGRATATLLALRVEDVAEYGALEISALGRVESFCEKSRGGPGWINAGVYALGDAVLRERPDSPHSLERDVLPRLAAEGRLFALAGRFFFRDIGTPERILLAQKEFSWVRRRMDSDPDLLRRKGSSSSSPKEPA